VKDRNTLKEDIANAHSTHAVLSTDGLGRAVECTGQFKGDPGRVAASLDIASAALQALGPAISLGQLQDAVLTFTDGVIVLGTLDGRSMFAVVAQPGTNVGLLLNQVRRVVSDEPKATVADE
jgi:predicted regulator of Ras-like GTPase activity (Roadblock/LC7/MglB family)